jgi:hypothetical protein
MFKAIIPMPDDNGHYRRGTHTDRKPRANNWLVRGKKGVHRDVVEEGKLFMVAGGIGSILI